MFAIFCEIKSFKKSIYISLNSPSRGEAKSKYFSAAAEVHIKFPWGKVSNFSWPKVYFYRKNCRFENSMKNALANLINCPRSADTSTHCALSVNDKLKFSNRKSDEDATSSDDNFVVMLTRK